VANHAGTVIDAEFTVVNDLQTTVTTIPPEHVESGEVSPAAKKVSDDDEPTTPELITELIAVTSQFPGENGARITADEIHRRLCVFAGVDSPHKATRGQIRSLIARCREALSR
jgi:hypothetical protein